MDDVSNSRRGFRCPHSLSLSLLRFVQPIPSPSRMIRFNAVPAKISFYFFLLKIESQEKLMNALEYSGGV